MPDAWEYYAYRVPVVLSAVFLVLSLWESWCRGLDQVVNLEEPESGYRIWGARY